MVQRQPSSFSLAAAGDTMLSRRLQTHAADPFGDISKIVENADAGFLNLETTIHNFEGYPAAHTTGTHMRSPPWTLDELSDAGFNLLAVGNNHSGDYTFGGIKATIRELKERNFTHAGLGMNLAEARAPAYLDTPGGRVGLVAAVSTFVSGTEAGHQRKDMQGRPGVSPLTLGSKYYITRKQLEMIREISGELGLEEMKKGLGLEETEDTCLLWNVNGRTHPQFEVDDTSRVRLYPSQRDKSEILEQIELASKKSNWMVASLHLHEGKGGRINDQTVPPFLRSFARDCINAGADVFLCHGPHVLRGIELYDGAPLFYSLGNFALQDELIDHLPAEMYYGQQLSQDALSTDVFETRDKDGDGPLLFTDSKRVWQSVLPVCSFENGRLSRIDLHPLELGADSPRYLRGSPQLARGELAEEILDNLSQLSADLGTDVERKNKRGVVTV